MKEINLSRKNVAVIITNYPDGQQDVTIDPFYLEEGEITIKSRMNSFKDIELILCTTAALKRLGVKEIVLDTPYILGARCDRKFREGGTSYLRDIIAPILNSQEYKKVKVLDIHNPVAADACINNLEMVDNSELVKEVLQDIGPCTILSPDAGAAKKVYDMCKHIGYTGQVIECSKKRDNMGNIVDTVVPITDCKGENILIVDDICDGGRTFIEMTKKIQLLNPGKIYLCVTHGIFSNGYEELSKYMEQVYCTNSVKYIDNLLIKQTIVI